MNVETDERRRATNGSEAVERVNKIVGGDGVGDADRDGLAGVLIDDVQQLDLPAIDGANALIKKVKRVAHGMTNFRNWRIRVLLAAGRPDWNLLPHLTPAPL